MRHQKGLLRERFSNLNTANIDKLAKEIDQQVFEKTDCLSCGNCCKSAPPIINQNDINRIAKFLNVSSKQFIRNFIIQDFNGEMSFDRIPCTFLDDDNRCRIYEVRPDACRDYPHIKSGNFMRRLTLHETNMEICPAAEKIIDKMLDKLTEDDKKSI